MATQIEVVDRWLIEAGRDDPKFLHSSDNMFVTRVTADPPGLLYYDREGRGQWGRGRPARNLALARFIGERYKGGCCLLNGDGFEDNIATDWQASLRTRARQTFGLERTPIIPYEALRGAQVDVGSIRVIEVSDDREEQRNNHIPLKKSECRRDMIAADEAWPVMTRTGSTYAVTERRLSTGERVKLYFYGHTRTDDYPYIAQIYAQPQYGQFQWINMSTTDSPYEDENNYYWTERVHRLGASLFSAAGADGVRHRWLSAFDMKEHNPLYFLAQLPGNGKVKTFDEALESLAPTIVKKAKEQGKDVHRQGDVFAIETNWTDEMVYDGCFTRVRREVALQDVRARMRRGENPLPTVEGEVTDKVECPCCRNRVTGGWGPKARKALQIHATSHTATEVVTHKDGRTFIRGRMYHNPELETAGRRPEHDEVRLSHEEGRGETRTWYLAVRNTVPRQKAPVRTTRDTSTADAISPPAGAVAA